MEKEVRRFICENPRGYHYQTEVNNFSRDGREPYEECGRYCDHCPFLTIVEEKGNGGIEVVQSGHPETVGYDDYEPQVLPLSEMPTDELKTMLEGLKETRKLLKKALKEAGEEKRPSELSKDDVQFDLDRTEEMIREIKRELRGRQGQ